jgi:WD40 repeat protein
MTTNPQQIPTHFSRRQIFKGAIRLTAIGTGLMAWENLMQSSPVFAASALDERASTDSRPPRGTTLFVYHGHTLRVLAVTWSPNGRRIASGGIDKTVQVWDATTGKLIFIQGSASDQVYDPTWSPGGRYLAFSDSNVVQIWDFSQRKLLSTHGDEQNPSVFPKWSSNSKLIASGSGSNEPGVNNTVRVWQAE